MLEPSKNRVVEDSDNVDDCFIPPFEVAVDNKFKYLQIPMIQDSAGFIYYVTSQYGKQCEIMEGNPRDPYIKRHKCIFIIKTQGCLGISGNGDKF